METASESFHRGRVRGYVHFGSPTHEIDSKTLATTLVETGNLLERIGQHLAPDNTLVLRVGVFEKGSFEFPFDLRALMLPALLAVQPVLPLLKQSFDVMIQFLKLKQALKGEPLKEKGKGREGLTITGDNNTTLTVNADTVNMYVTDPLAHQAVERQFTRLGDDRNVNRYELLDKRKRPLLQISRENFTPLARRPSDATHDRAVRIEQVDSVLVVVKPFLENKPGSWRFIDQNGQSISALMADKRFLERVGKGERFAKGDTLRVRLQTSKEYDAALGVHMIKKREVTEVIKHVQRLHQLDLPDDSDSV